MESNKSSDEIEIDIGELLRALWSKKLIIILSGVAAALIAVFFSQVFLPETFQSSTKIYVLNQQSSDMITYSDLQSGTQLTKDYQEIIKGRTVLEKVISDLKLDMTYDELTSMVSVSVPADTRILRITVTGDDPYQAMNITNAVRESAAEHISAVMNIETINVAEAANLPESSSGPNIKRNGMLAGLVGILIAVVIVLLIYILDDTIKTPDDVERYLEVGVLGSIPYDAKPISKAKPKRKEVVQNAG